MAKAITEVAIGAAAIAAPFVIPGLGIAVSDALISAGASLALSGAMTGLAALTNNHAGLAVATTTPIGPWGYIYGTQQVGGIEIFRQSNNSQGTSNNDQLHRVYVLACHPCQADAGGVTTFQLRIDGKQVQLQPSSDGYGYNSFTPTQLTPNIASISRDSDGLVTFKIATGISGLNGQEIQIYNSADNTLNGIWIVTQPNPADDTTFNFVCGGTPTPSGTNPGGTLKTLYPDYQDKIYVEFLDGNHTSTFEALLNSGTNWSTTDLCLGRTLVYVRMGWDQAIFPSGVPNVSFVLPGKSNIYDPRGPSTGFTNNAALCIADFLATPVTQGGFGLTIGTDIPTAQLIAAANICDEEVALAEGGTVARYTCDTFFQLNQTRGTILQQMLSSCAGRISYQGGQFNIFPGAWLTPTLQITDSDIVGTFKFRPRLKSRESCNGVKGVYCSAVNNYQMADFPPYMQDLTHGYDSNPSEPQYQGDEWIAEDNGERIFSDVHLPCTVSPATAQRLAKIALLRTRFQMRGTIRCTMKAYQAVALDVIQITHPRYTWENANFEVLSSRFVWDKSGNVPQIAVELDVAQTDPTIYDWSITEELTPQGYSQSTNVGNSVCNPPNAVLTYSGPGATVDGVVYPSTISTTSDGTVTNSIYVTWQTPNDTNVVLGGHIEVQWKISGASSWNAWGKLDPSVNQAFINGISSGVTYLVQVRAVNCAGVPSPWVIAAPVGASSVWSVSFYSGIPVAPAGTLTAIAVSGGTALINIGDFTPFYGEPCVPNPASLTGLEQGQMYWVYYIDPAFAGGTITPIATETESDCLNKAGYFLIGSVMTPTFTPLYRPSAWSSTGQVAPSNPTAAYDGNTATDAILQSSWWTVSTGSPPTFTYESAACTVIWEGFPSVVTTSTTTLNVLATCTGGGSPVTSMSASIVVTIGGTPTTIAALTAPTAETTYTLSIPSGTDLSTITVTGSSNITAGTSNGGGDFTLLGFEVWIQ